MPQKIDLNTLDRRIADRLIRQGLLSAEEWQKHVESRADVAEKAEPIAAKLETGVIQGR